MAAGTLDDISAGAVLAAAVRGEHWALTELFRVNHAGIVRYLRAQEPGVADDLAGEVWVAVASKLAAFVGDERDFRCWLFAIARNRLLGYRRQAVRRRTDPVAPERFDIPAASEDAGDPAGMVVDGLCAQDAVDLLVAGLSPLQTEVLLMRVVAGLSVSEVARAMDRSPGAVRAVQHRALRRLNSRFSPDGVGS